MATKYSMDMHACLYVTSTMSDSNNTCFSTLTLTIPIYNFLYIQNKDNRCVFITFLLLGILIFSNELSNYIDFAVIYFFQTFFELAENQKEWLRLGNSEVQEAQRMS